MKAIRRIIILLCVLIVSNSLAYQEYKPRARRKALIIACDKFIDYPSTEGACKKNAEEIYKLFSHGNLFIDDIIRKYDTISSESDFSQEIWEAFGDSGPEDKNYLYISTHGLKKSKKYDDSAIVLGNGEYEEEISSKAIAGSFDGVLGTNIIIIDACYSGAIINRGVSGGGKTNYFDGNNFKVITSSGGAEQSWYWVKNNNNDLELQGAGFFSAGLCKALSKADNFPADTNIDGIITHNELYQYLYSNNASSCVRAYPYNDDTEIFIYSPSNNKENASVTNLRFSDSYIDSDKDYIDFSYDVTRPVQVLYQIVYYRNNIWDYECSEYYFDPLSQNNEKLSAGNYKRKIILNKDKIQKSGYALINVLAKYDKSLRFIASKQIAILDNKGLSKVSIKTSSIFNPKRNQELIILAEHDLPCFITLDILDSNNNLVYNIANSRLSRPENLSPNASSFVWNGICSNGSLAPEGEYIVRARFNLLDQTIEAVSKKFKLQNK